MCVKYSHYFLSALICSPIHLIRLSSEMTFKIYENKHALSRTTRYCKELCAFLVTKVVFVGSEQIVRRESFHESFTCCL